MTAPSLSVRCSRTPLIERDWHDIRRYALGADGRCPHCGTAIAGRFGEFTGAFGPRRIPVNIAHSSWA